MIVGKYKFKRDEFNKIYSFFMDEKEDSVYLGVDKTNSVLPKHIYFHNQCAVILGRNSFEIFGEDSKYLQNEVSIIGNNLEKKLEVIKLEKIPESKSNQNKNKLKI